MGVEALEIIIIIRIAIMALTLNRVEIILSIRLKTSLSIIHIIQAWEPIQIMDRP